MRLERRILVVDDEDAIRTLVATVLRRRGLPVDTARSGDEALERIAGCRYALIVLDLMMPRVSGYDVLAHLAGMDAEQRPLVLLLTAGLRPRAVDSSMIVGTIEKPFDLELLVETVLSCIKTRPAEPQIDTCAPMGMVLGDEPN